MEEKNDIFLADGDALVYSTGLIHKKYSTTFVWGHIFSAYLSFDRFFNPASPCTHMYAFRVNSLLRAWFHRFDTFLSLFDFARLP